MTFGYECRGSTHFRTSPPQHMIENFVTICNIKICLLQLLHYQTRSLPVLALSQLCAMISLIFPTIAVNLVACKKYIRIHDVPKFRSFDECSASFA